MNKFEIENLNLHYGDFHALKNRITKKTKASKDLKGTLATHYLIGFNNGNEIELRLIAKSDLVVRQDNRIAYQDNINKGVRL